MTTVPVRRSLLHGLVLMLLLAVWAPGGVRAQGIDLATLELQRQDGELTLDFEVHVTLPRAVEDALQRGVPVYFVAQATLYRDRWYWRDERVARVTRSWRIAYQPLTSTWRVGFGGFNQSFQTLPEALATVSRSSRWKVVDLAQLDGELAPLPGVQLPAGHLATAQPVADRPGRAGRLGAGCRAHPAHRMSLGSRPEALRSAGVNRNARWVWIVAAIAGRAAGWCWPS